LTLTLPEGDVKNGTPFEMQLPEASARLVELYLSTYRPLLCPPGAEWVFPGRTIEAPKTSVSLRDQIQKSIAGRCGLHFNPHLFRHLAGQIMLEDNPAAHGLVQRILGHKSINTTLSFYSGTETKAAHRHYEALILKHREDLPPKPGSRRRPKGGR
jgi:integrase